jgi:hypothetical protein
MIQFRNGHATDAPEMLVEFRGLRRCDARLILTLGNFLFSEFFLIKFKAKYKT